MPKLDGEEAPAFFNRDTHFTPPGRDCGPAKQHRALNSMWVLNMAIDTITWLQSLMMRRLWRENLHPYSIVIQLIKIQRPPYSHFPSEFPLRLPILRITWLCDNAMPTLVEWGVGVELARFPFLDTYNIINAQNPIHYTKNSDYSQYIWGWKGNGYFRIANRSRSQGTTLELNCDNGRIYSK